MKKIAQSLHFWFAESFLPFVLLIIALFAGLQYVDSLIENRDTTLVIRLDSDAGDEEQSISIKQQIEISGSYNGGQKSKLKKINHSLERGLYRQALSQIKELDSSLQKEAEVIMSRAYCQMKLGDHAGAEKLLLQVDGEKYPRRYYNQGLLYGGQKERRKEAIVAYEKYLGVNPSSYEALMNVGWLYYKSKNYDKAHELYTRAASLSRSEREVRALYRLGKIAEKKDQAKEAIKLYEKALRKDPGNAAVRIALGNLQLEKDPERATELLRSALELDPQNPRGYYLLGRYHHDQKEYAVAAKWLRQGVKYLPQDDNLFSLLGHVYLKGEEYEQARLVYEKLLARFPNKALYHFNLAKAYSGKDDYELALLSYAHAIELDPRYYEAILNSGVIYARLDRTQEAISWYKRALSFKPKEAKIYYNLGVLYRNSKRYSEALGAFSKAVSLSKKYPSALLNMGVIYSRQNQNEKAIDYYRRAIEQDADYTLAYYNLSLLLEKMGRLNESIELIEPKIKNSTDHRLYVRYASGHKKKGDWQKAKEYYQRSLNLKPGYSIAELGMAEIYLHEKNYDKVIESAKEYLFRYPKNVEMRYLYMASAWHKGEQEAALKQYKILQRLSSDEWNDFEGVIGKIKEYTEK